MVKIFHDNFERDEDIINEFKAPANVLEGATVKYALYRYEDYEGHALVIFEKAGKLYEVNASHCSCYGLEDQWSPEETSWAALALRSGFTGLAEVVAENA